MGVIKDYDFTSLMPLKTPKPKPFKVVSLYWTIILNFIFRNHNWWVIWEKSATYRTATTSFHLENWKKRSMTVHWVVGMSGMSWVGRVGGDISVKAGTVNHTVEPTWNAK